MHDSGRDDGRPADRDLVTVNGMRVVTEDGTWGLVRASSNKPGAGRRGREPGLEEKMRAMFRDLDAVIRERDPWRI